MSHQPSVNPTVFLSNVIQNYKEEVHKPSGKLSHLLHFHEKNAGAEQQIKLLEQIRNYIHKNLPTLDGQKAELGALLILRALLADPNEEREVFYYLIDEIKLNEEILHALKQIDPNETMEPTDASYFKLSKEAIHYCRKIIELPQTREKFTDKPNFIPDVLNTIVAELDYDSKMLISMGQNSRPTWRQHLRPCSSSKN